MEWLSQNWIWLVLAAAGLWFFTRRGHGGAMGGCGMAHEGPQDNKDKAQSPSAPSKESAPSGHRHRGGCC